MLHWLPVLLALAGSTRSGQMDDETRWMQDVQRRAQRRANAAFAANATEKEGGGGAGKTGGVGDFDTGTSKSCVVDTADSMSMSMRDRMTGELMY